MKQYTRKTEALRSYCIYNIQKKENILKKLILTTLIIFFIYPGWSQESKNCSLVGSWPYGPCYTNFINGDYAYIGSGRILQIVNVSNLNFPKLIGEIVTLSVIYDIVVSGDYAYLADFAGGLRIVDISEPDVPKEVGFFDAGINARHLFLKDNYVYLVDRDKGFYIVDVATPAAPVLAGVFPAGDSSSDIYVDKNYAYAIERHTGLHIFDIGTPSSAIEIAALDFEELVNSVYVQDHFVYVGGNSNLFVVDISTPSAPRQVGVTLVDSRINEIEVNGHSVYLATNDGLVIVDVSTPSEPKSIGAKEYPSSLKDIRVHGSFAYVAASNVGMRFIYIRTASLLTEVGFFNTQGLATNIFVKNQYAYLAHWSGLQILDIATPDSPTEIGFFKTQTSVNGVFVKDNYAYLANGDDGLRIVDITNPASPVEVGFWDTEHHTCDIHVQGNYAYLADGSYGFLRIIDISTPTAPVEVGHYDIIGGFAHNLCYCNNHVYVAASGAGLRVFDVSTPASPTEVGFFESGSIVYDVYYSGNNVYLAEDVGLRIVDVSTPSSPTERGFYASNEIIQSVVYQYPYAYITNRSLGLRMLDIRNPKSPIEVGYFVTGNSANAVFVQDSTICVTKRAAGLYILQNDLLTGDIQDHVLSLDGEGDYVSFPNLVQTLNNFTISFWFSPATTWNSDRTKSQALYEARGDQSYVSIRLEPDGRLMFRTTVLGVTDDCFSTTDSWIGGNWYHIAVTAHSASHLKTVYVNGIQENSTSPAHNFVLKTEYIHFLGRPEISAYSYFHGQIDEVRIWHRTKSQAEIQVDMDTNLTGREPGLFGYWNFNSGTARDESMVGFHGTLMGDAEIIPKDMTTDLKSCEMTAQPPKQFILSKNFPNPFNLSTTIQYELIRVVKVEISIFNMLGQRINVLENNHKPAGFHEVQWQGTDEQDRLVPSGIYVCQIRAGSFKQSMKLMLLK